MSFCLIMSEVALDNIREERIKMKVVVDAHNEEERAMGWYCYLEDRLNFPFKAEWVNNGKTNVKKVTVVEMSPEDDCLEDIFVEVLDRENKQKDVFSVRLSNLQPLDSDSATEEAIGDWHYWLAREYEF